AARIADIVIATSDNPRSEDPLKILHEIERGIVEAGLDPIQESAARREDASGYLVIPDRRRAIHLAIEIARKSDVVLIAGEGHEFVGAALERGATAAMVEHEGGLPGQAAWIRVADGVRALGDLAAAWRRQLGVRVVGVTGSNGKTTTKEMIAAVLGASGAPVAKSRGTENNLIGLPQTLLRLTGEEAFAVLEMGMNHAG